MLEQTASIAETCIFIDAMGLVVHVLLQEGKSAFVHLDQTFMQIKDIIERAITLV